MFCNFFFFFSTSPLLLLQRLRLVLTSGVIVDPFEFQSSGGYSGIALYIHLMHNNSLGCDVARCRSHRGNGLLFFNHTFYVWGTFNGMDCSTFHVIGRFPCSRAATTVVTCSTVCPVLDQVGNHIVWCWSIIGPSRYFVFSWRVAHLLVEPATGASTI